MNPNTSLNWQGVMGTLAVSLLLQAPIGNCVAQEPEGLCYEPEQAPPPTLPTAGILDVALIYVTFPLSSGDPNPNPVLPSTVDTARAVNFPSALRQFFLRQSKGALDLNFFVVEVPGSPSAMWLANHPPSIYGDPTQVVQLNPNNSDCYWGTPGAEPTGTRQYTDGELPAEILRAVVAAYAGSDPVSQADLVAMVHAADVYAFFAGGNPGGWAGLGMCTDDCCPGLPSQAMGPTIEWGPSTSLATATMTMAHEIGHNLGLSNLHLSDVSGIEDDAHTPYSWMTDGAP